MRDGRPACCCAHAGYEEPKLTAWDYSETFSTAVIKACVGFFPQ
jgi:hypothetical protein